MQIYLRNTTGEESIDAAQITASILAVFKEPMDLFHPDVLKNQEVINQIYAEFIGVGMKPEPGLPKNSRLVYKVCNIKFPGQSNSEIGEKCKNATKAFYIAEKNKSPGNNTQSGNTTTSNQNQPQATVSSTHGNTQ